MNRVQSERGMSLVEATIILMVLASLTAAIAPAINGYSNDARNVAAKKDVETIGSAISAVVRDTGYRCLRRNGGTNDCSVVNRVDLLISGGSDPRAVTAANTALTDAAAATTTAGGLNVNWLGSTVPPLQQNTMDEQFILNNMATPYTTPTFTGGGGPRMKLGWRGPYLTGPISSDPWGTKYQASTMFLTVATDAIDAVVPLDQSSEGLREAGWNRDVVVLSAGANKVAETSFGGTATTGVTAVGDDVTYVLSGGSR